MASVSFQTSAGERNRISFRSILGSGTRRHGVCGIMPASTAAAITWLTDLPAIRLVRRDVLLGAATMVIGVLIGRAVDL